MAKKGRAWANLKGVIPDEPEDTLSPRMRAVFEAKDKLVNEKTGRPLTMIELAQEYQSLEEEEAFAELAAGERSIKFEAIERRVLEELEKVKQVSGQDMWRGEGQTFSPKNLLIPIVKDKAALRRWIEETGQVATLELPKGRLTEIVASAMNTDEAAVMTPAERAKLQPGDPASLQPPPGVEVYIRTVTHHTSAKKGGPKPSKDTD